MENANMPETVLEKIKGRDLPADLQKKLKMQPDRLYTIKAQPQEDRQSLREVVDEMREQAEKNGLTPEILADILGVSVEEIS